jgi:hypothetical protein
MGEVVLLFSMIWLPAGRADGDVLVEATSFICPVVSDHFAHLRLEPISSGYNLPRLSPDLGALDARILRTGVSSRRGIV